MSKTPTCTHCKQPMSIVGMNQRDNTAAMCTHCDSPCTIPKCGRCRNMNAHREEPK